MPDVFTCVNLGKMDGSMGQPFSSMMGKVDLASLATATQDRAKMP